MPYNPTDKSLWQGRMDGTSDCFLRWHQVIECIDLRKVQLSNYPDSIAFLGFECDEGVSRNEGRTGAKDGPNAIRKILSNLPVNFSKPLSILDLGNISCETNQLENAQSELSNKLESILTSKVFPILLGGGHEITYAHFCGLRKHFSNIGIINIDAHFDMREPRNGVGNSGTGFYQIAEDLGMENSALHYLAIGIQSISNTKALFDIAANNQVDYILSENIFPENLVSIIQQIKDFSQKMDAIYLTIDMDAFAAPYAPGVSALAFNGIIPDRTFQQIYQTILHLPNLVSMDIAELNPSYDIDHRTAKLAADLIFKAVQSRSNI